jgi:NAD-dependent oxidoreductase involved in siderophore biosynthesis
MTKTIKTFTIADLVFNANSAHQNPISLIPSKKAVEALITFGNEGSEAKTPEFIELSRKVYSALKDRLSAYAIKGRDETDWGVKGTTEALNSLKEFMNPTEQVAAFTVAPKAKAAPKARVSKADLSVSKRLDAMDEKFNAIMALLTAK